ncbi:MAG: sensory box histidine kinase, partial [Conexibacter sp.]|nr:sensory box histidine kinase [Conexibacter sp.]
MVHRSAPPRLTAAFGVMLVAGGLAALARWALIGDTPYGLAGSLVACVLGAGVLVRRDRLTYRDVGWIAVACTVLVGVTIASRDTPYGAGYAYVWGTPFAFAAGRRVAIAMTAAVAGTLAAAFAVQALRVAEPLAFHTYLAWWLTVVLVGGVTRVIVGSLEATQRRLDRGFDQGVLGMAFVDLAGRWQEVNRALAEILGRAPEELVGAPADDVTHPDDLAISRELLAQAPAQGTVAFDKRYVRPDGSVRWVTVHAVVLRDGRGAPTGIFSEYEDITARRAAEEAARDSESRFQRAFEDTGVGMLLIQLDGTILKANRAVAELFGAPPAAIVGTGIAGWQHPEDRDGGADGARGLLSAGGPETFHRDARYVRRDGRVTHAAVTAALIRDAGGAPSYIVCQLVDVTERDAAQRREAALAELGRDALQAGSLTGLLQLTARVVAETLDAPFGAVLDAGSREVLAAHGWRGTAAADHAAAVLDAPGALVMEHAERELR